MGVPGHPSHGQNERGKREPHGAQPVALALQGGAARLAGGLSCGVLIVRCHARSIAGHPVGAAPRSGLCANAAHW